MSDHNKPGFAIFYLIIGAVLISLISVFIGYTYSQHVLQGGGTQGPPSTTVSDDETTSTTDDLPDASTTTTSIDTDQVITDFEQCKEAGYAVMESYPEQCGTPDGRSFTQNIGNELEKTDLITISSPRPNLEVTSPMKIEGQARGNWFFEASFPVKIELMNGDIIASGIATAQGEWMTEDFVPYKAELEFNVTVPTNASLILEKNNASGLPEHDDTLLVPVKLMP